MSKESNIFSNFFQQIIDSLNLYKIPYVLVGGTVMPFYGNIRSTQDIDIMLLLDDISEITLKSWLNYLEEEGFAMSTNEIIYALNKKIHANIFEPKTYAFRVDLKQIHTDLDRMTYRFRRKVEINNRMVWINSAESQIAVKLSPGFRSDTDLDDVITIIESVDLDIDLLSKFLRESNSKLYLCEMLQTIHTENTILLFNQLDC